MKRFIYPAVAALVLSASAFTFITATPWKIADGYAVNFSAGGDVAGVFKTISGTIVFDDQNPAASKFDVTIDLNSANTGNGLQNKHLKSAEWLDATKYPTAHFVSQKFVKAANGYQVTGTFDLHGVSKTITIPFTFQKTAKGATFAGTFAINRNDFKIGKPGGEVDDQVKLDIAVPVTK